MESASENRSASSAQATDADTTTPDGAAYGIKFAPVTFDAPFRAVLQAPSPDVDAGYSDSAPSSPSSQRPHTSSSQQSHSPSSQHPQSPHSPSGLRPAGFANGHGFSNGKPLRLAPLSPLARTSEPNSPHERPSTSPATPPGRRSVSFARPPPGPSAGTTGRSASVDAEDTDAALKDRRGRAAILSRLRNFASLSHGTHGRSPSGYTIGAESIEDGIGEMGSDSGLPSATDTGDGREDGSQSDADSEMSDEAQRSNGNEQQQHPPRSRRRKSRRPPQDGMQTAPTTPKGPPMRNGRPLLPSFPSQNSSDRPSRLHPILRRSTLSELPHERQVVSEDEGRDRITNRSPWRHRYTRAISSNSMARRGHSSVGGSSRPTTMRRALSGFAGGDTSDAGPSPWKRRGERTASLSAAKWRRLKASIKMIGRQRKAEITVDHAKSAELLAELSAGVPAAIIFASMFQRDEHGHKRIPILLEQLKVRLADSRNVSSRSGDRHMLFRIELEYGNGLTRMKWIVYRTLRDFTNLHTKYKLQASAKRLQLNSGAPKLPHFPRAAFPILRTMRGEGSDTEPEDTTDREAAEASGTERPHRPRRRPAALSMLHRKSSVGDAVFAPSAGGTWGDEAVTSRKDAWPERQRRYLESYLQHMIRYLMFRPESNRLCKFFELSALGIRLSAEGSYHGKEGYLVIKSGKGVDFRRAWQPSMVKNRHLPKWFLVRHSYIVCVDSPEEMNIYDVFLVDADFRMQAKRARIPFRGQDEQSLARVAPVSASHPQHHRLKLHNSERKLKLLAKHERQLRQFEESIRQVLHTTPWAQRNRFDSFAPVRTNVFAQWLVDGRDYMWNVSRAIGMAKDVIYIHDWWLSPELYMRRPAAISKKWRLDRLLQRKAREGVKVFVIVYRNINSAIPIDSEYSKFSLLDLDPNVFVQRSPNQIRQGTFFWAHHEKICIVDHMIAFVGGIDLCFGRWDTPQHQVADDKLTGFEDSEVPKDADHCQLWPGKDYSNPRVQDFYALDKPYEEMYDRSKVPRMPWHDISMQIVGQPARDLTRHFVQRWNYILRQRKPTRPTPFLLPPPDFNTADLEALGLDGTCEVQILRSCAMWSMGTPDRIEHSIMNAYVKMIEQSEHFVYIENQFYVSSCEVEGTRIENRISDAIVERIIRAHRNEEHWRAVVIIPLMPGFQNTVDSQDGTSVRLIMQCQYRSISRGDLSIFGRLRAEGIEPDDYIQFFSLRSWGRIGPKQALVSEQLYIHAKCMIVDDRVAIIGSANINERSMLGNRDSECAAVVRDTDMLWSTMHGEQYLVGRFPHTLRMRLMREHLGVDVDEAMEEERAEFAETGQDAVIHPISGPDAAPAKTQEGEDADTDETRLRLQEAFLLRNEQFHSFNHDADLEQARNPNLQSNKKLTSDPRVTGNEEHRKDVDGEGFDQMRSSTSGLTATARLHKSLSASPSLGRERSRSDHSNGETGNPPLPPTPLLRASTFDAGLPRASQLPPLPQTDDTDIGCPTNRQRFFSRSSVGAQSLLATMRQPTIDKDCMRDPLNEDFYNSVWQTVAENNTTLFRSVFRCMPDNEVKTWKDYKEYAVYAERFAQLQGSSQQHENTTHDMQGTSGPPGAGAGHTADGSMLGPIREAAADAEKMASRIGDTAKEKLPVNNEKSAHPTDGLMDYSAEAARENAAAMAWADRSPRSTQEAVSVFDEKAASRGTLDSPVERASDANVDGRLRATSSATMGTQGGSGSRRKRRTTRGSRREFRASDDIINRADALQLLEMVRGHLVVWPYDWLVKEEQGGNWLYSIDQLAPLEIYN